MTVALAALTALAEGRCPLCAAMPTGRRQVGRYVVLEPCGHRYQGQLGAAAAPVAQVKRTPHAFERGVYLESCVHVIHAFGASSLCGLLSSDPIHAGEEP